MDDSKIRSFLDGLTELTKKTGVMIGGCGCCDSPYLMDTSEFKTKVGDNSFYHADIRSEGCVSFCNTSDKFQVRQFNDMDMKTVIRSNKKK